MVIMSEYDSILKGEKKIEVVEKEPKKFPKFWVSFFLIIIVLVVSYIIYFNNVLSAYNIIINDSVKILNKYNTLSRNIPFDEYKKENNLVGTISYKEDIFNFNFIKNVDNLNFNISNNDKYINYYLISNSSYVKVSSVNEYVLINSLFNINSLIELRNNLSKIDKNKYIKNIYLEGEKPIVEVNLTLSTTELNDIFGFNLVDDCEVIATFKNSAVMNEIEEIKIIINNKTTLERRVITIYEDKVLYKINDDTYKLVLEPNGDDFMLKISKNDVLYSVLSGTNNSDKYTYTYQVINTKYNISISTSKTTDGYFYEITKKENELEESLNINLKVENSYVIENKATNFVDLNDELIKQAYSSEINYFKDKFSYFIN